MRELAEAGAAFDLAGGQLPESTDSGDHRIDDLVQCFPTDQPFMVVATAERNVAGGVLAFRNDNGAVTLRIIGCSSSSISQPRLDLPSPSPRGSRVRQSASWCPRGSPTGDDLKPAVWAPRRSQRCA